MQRFAVLAFAVFAIFAPAASAAPTVYVTNLFSNNLSAYSTASDGGLSPVAGSPFATGAIAPIGVAMSPGGERLYAANSESNTVSVFAVGANGALSPVPGSPYATRTWPWGVAVAPDGAHVYVTNSGANSVSAYAVTPDGGISPIPGSPFSTGSPTVDMKSNGIALTPDGAHLYVTNMNGGNVSAFSVAADGSLSPVAGSPFDAGATARSVSVTPDGKYLYVGNATSHDISVYSIGSDGALSQIPGSPFATEGAPLGVTVAPGGSHLYVAHIGLAPNVWAYSIAPDGGLGPVPGSPFPSGGIRGNSVAVSPDGKHLYSSNNGSHDLSAFSVAADGSLSLVAGSPFATERGPLQVVVTPDQGPTAGFSATATPAGNLSSFDASASSDPDGDVASYRWDFGDGQTEVTSTAATAHLYASPGDYTVTLTTTDDAGCSTAQTFTGQTVSCNGSPLARVAHEITVLPGVSLGVSRTGSGSGSVTSSPSGITCPGACSYAFVPGTQVTLTASPAPGSSFTGWAGGGCSDSQITCEVSVVEARAVEAQFTIDTHVLDVVTEGSGSGSVSSAPARVSECGTPAGNCRASFDYGTVVVLTARPEPGSAFAGWSGGGCSGTGNCQVAIAADTAVTATFSKPPLPPPPPAAHTLAVAVAGDGSGAVGDATGTISCPPACSQAFAADSRLTLLATPALGSRFAGWSGSDCSQAASCGFTIGADTALTARFERIVPLQARLRITRAWPKPSRGRLTVAIGGAIANEARGVVVVEIRARLDRQYVAETKRAWIRNGGWHTRLGLPRSMPHSPAALEVRTRFGGSPGVRGGSATRQVTVNWRSS